MNKKKDKNKKGFSLIELLAVLVILTIIMGITIPIISSSLKRNEVSQADINREKLETLTEMYITDNKEKIYDEMEQNQQSKCFVSLKTLINQGYLIDADLDVIGEENEYIIFEKPNHYTYTKNIQDIQNIRACSHEDEILNEAEYTVLLNQNGGKNGTESVLAIYNKPMPSINKPNLTYTINYDNNAPPNTKTEKLSSTVNYNFEGYWSKYDGTGTKYYTSTGTSAINYDIKGNSTLYAYWTSRSTALLTPTSIPGYTFEGWYKERTGETLIGKPNATYTPKENVNLYGKWSVNTYNITLNKQSGTGGTNTIYQKYAIGIYLDDKLKTQMTTTTNAITLPTRTGYTFQGYYTKTNGQGTQMINNNGLITSNFTNNQYTENTTLYAYWTINNYYVDLNWTLDGSNFNPKETSEACAYVEIGGTSKGCVTDYYTKHPHGTTYKITKIKLNGTDISYSYSGTINGNNLSHAISLNTFIINRNNDSYGTVSLSPLYVKNGTTFTTSSNVLSLNDGRKITATPTQVTGYTTTFKNWSSTSGKITSETTVVANFNRTINNYKITLSANNSSYGTVSSTSVTVPYNSTYSVDSNNKLIFKNSSGTVIKTITATPTALAGHTTQFTGWDSTTGTITADKTIKANFSRTKDNYTVTISRNDNSYGTVSSTSVSIPYNTTYSVNSNVLTFSNGTKITATPTTATAQYSYNFSSWSKNSGTITKNETITANFTRSGKKYTATMNANGGTNGSDYSATWTATYGNSYNLDSYIPIRTGYTFAGWYSAANGGSKFSGNWTWTATSNYTFYAHWTRNFTCASAGGTTTYAGKSWYTISNDGTYCTLAAKFQSNATGNYNSATTNLNTSFFNSGGSDYNATMTAEKNAGLLATVNGSYYIDTDAGTTSPPTGIYWTGNSAIYDSSARNNYICNYSYKYYGALVATGSEDLLPYYIYNCFSTTNSPYAAGARTVSNTDSSFNYNVSFNEHTPSESSYYSSFYSNFDTYTVDTNVNVPSSFNLKFNRWGSVDYTLYEYYERFQIRIWPCGGPYHGNTYFRFRAVNKTQYEYHNYATGTTTNRNYSGTHDYMVAGSGGYTDLTFNLDGKSKTGYDLNFSTTNTCKTAANTKYYSINSSSVALHYRPRIKVKL